MSSKHLKQLSYLLISIFLTLGLSLSLQSLLAAWIPPTLPPPDGNVSAPLNESGADQVKLGGLGIGKNFIVTGNSFLTGNVGIGTTGPGALLDVSGLSSGLSLTSAILQNTGSAANSSSRLILRNAVATGINSNGNDILWQGASSANLGQLVVNNNGSGGSNMVFGTRTNAGSLTDKVTIDNAGNVGIGTTNPTQKLEVAGYVKGQSGLCIGGDCRTTWPDAAGTYLPLAGGTMNAGSRVAFNGSGITSGDAYGIGNGAAYNNFNSIAVDTLETNGGVDGGVGERGTLELNYYGGNEVHIGPSGTKVIRAAIMYDGNDGSYYVDPASNSKFNSATFAGNVGIGTISPNTKLNLFDNGSGPIMSIQGSTANYRGIKIADALNNENWFYGANNSNNFVIRRSGGADNLTVNASGNVGIGTSNPTQKLEVAGGAIKATGGLILETRTGSDPASPVNGQIWLRPDCPGGPGC